MPCKILFMLQNRRRLLVKPNKVASYEICGIVLADYAGHRQRLAMSKALQVYDILRSIFMEQANPKAITLLTFEAVYDSENPESGFVRKVRHPNSTRILMSEEGLPDLVM